MKDMQTQIIFVLNIPKLSTCQLKQMFNRFGTILQVGIGNRADTQGTAYIVYSKVSEAVEAYNVMNNVQYQNKYIKIRYHQPFAMAKT